MAYYRQYLLEVYCELKKNHDRVTSQYDLCSSEVQTACIPNTSLDSRRYISLLVYLMLFPAEKVQDVFTLPLSNAAVTEILLLRQPVPPCEGRTESKFPVDTVSLCNNISLTAAVLRDTITNTPCIISSSPASNLHVFDSYAPHVTS